MEMLYISPCTGDAGNIHPIPVLPENIFKTSVLSKVKEKLTFGVSFVQNYFK